MFACICLDVELGMWYRFELLQFREAVQEIHKIASEMDEYEQDEDNEEWIEGLLKACKSVL